MTNFSVGYLMYVGVEWVRYRLQVEIRRLPATMTAAVMNTDDVDITAAQFHSEKRNRKKVLFV